MTGSPVSKRGGSGFSAQYPGYDPSFKRATLGGVSEVEFTFVRVWREWWLVIGAIKGRAHQPGLRHWHPLPTDQLHAAPCAAATRGRSRLSCAELAGCGEPEGTFPAWRGTGLCDMRASGPGASCPQPEGPMLATFCP